MVPDPATLDRFRANLDALIAPGTPLGLAVSGGSDSLALLILAAAVRPGDIEAATVDHGLRETSAAEADRVGDICSRMGVSHTVLRIEWDVAPSSAIQELAREVRYGALAEWMHERSFGNVATGHHLDDQAETLVMRLNRGAGVRGLSGMRPLASVPDHSDLQLLRPLLGWTRAGLEQVCADAGIGAIEDPSNSDERYERVRIRNALNHADWLDRPGLAKSASNLADADDAVEWAAALEWTRFAEVGSGEIVYRPSNAPDEILRRIVARAIAELGSEGVPDELKGAELDRLLGSLRSGQTATLRGVRCQGGNAWRFSRTAPRAR